MANLFENEDLRLTPKERKARRATTKAGLDPIKEDLTGKGAIPARSKKEVALADEAKPDKEISNQRHKRKPKSERSQASKEAVSGGHSVHDEKKSPRLEFNPKRTSWPMKTLYDTDMPVQRWAVPEIIPVGLTFLGGLPKSGKSWMALQIATAVGIGGKVFDIPVEKRKVLYLALEDGPQRLKRRCQAQNAPRGTQITFKIAWPLLEDGGIEKIEEFVVDHGYSFVVIDTLSRFCGKDQLKANDMALYLGKLQQMALKHNLSILINDHNSKGRLGSPIMRLFGSIAKSGVADMIYALERDEKSKVSAVLRGLGRDLGTIGEEVVIHLEWDEKKHSWKRGSQPPPPVKSETLKDKIRNAIREMMDEGVLATSTTIALRLNVKPSNVNTILTELFNDREALRLPKVGREVPYALADLS